MPCIHIRSIMSRNRIVILAYGDTCNMPLYRAWADAMVPPPTVVSEFDVDWLPPPDTALIITARQFHEPEAIILRDAMRSGIPVLILADGILEYRNTWLNPAVPPGGLYLPVAGHKIAVIGHGQARTLEAWGNAGKCEIVGCPRFDTLLQRKRPPRCRETARFLVATARTPGFTTEQRDLIRTSIADLKAWFDAHPRLNGRPVEVIWRLTGGLAEELGIPANDSSSTFHELLGDADALITTPSTTMLEGMLLDRPVAILDYTNSPSYVQAAWSMTAPVHMQSVIPELLEPPAARMRFQNEMLHDHLACATPATPRMLDLIGGMVRIGNSCRDSGAPLQFPTRMLPPLAPLAAPPASLSDLFPERVESARLSLAELQAENIHLRDVARRQQHYITDLIALLKQINRELQAKAPVYARVLRYLSLPKRPKLEEIPPTCKIQN